jgi:alpha-beta hydrolase superfamily lysophospholipase
VAVFRKLVASGVAVHTYDALGHGRSPALPRRGRHNVESFDNLVDDAAAFSKAALDGAYANAPPPAFIMGQSLGCALAKTQNTQKRNMRYTHAQAPTHALSTHPRARACPTAAWCPRTWCCASRRAGPAAGWC